MVLPKSMRLQGHRCFDHLHRSGNRYQSQSMSLRVVKAREKLLKKKPNKYESTSLRCAVTISSKVSKRAVVRNRLRRLLHDHLRVRLEKNSHNSIKWALISLKPCANSLDPFLLLQECDKLLNKAGLIS